MYYNISINTSNEGKTNMKQAAGDYQAEFDNVNNLKNKMVASPLQLQLKLDQAFVKVEEETMDCVYRAYLWQAFAGIANDYDALDVETADIDLYDMVIRRNDETYQLYKEAKDTFDKACRLESFVFKHPNYTIRRDRVAGAKLIRGVKVDNIKISTIRSLVCRKFKAIGFETSYSRIYQSGIFYRVYEKERAGLPIDFSDVIARKMKSNDYKISEKQTVAVITGQIKRALLADYIKWKQAFN